jgi:hypothetical protein
LFQKIRQKTWKERKPEESEETGGSKKEGKGAPKKVKKTNSNRLLFTRKYLPPMAKLVQRSSSHASALHSYKCQRC